MRKQIPSLDEKPDGSFNLTKVNPLGHSHALVRLLKDLPPVQVMHRCPFQLVVIGHWHNLVVSLRYCPDGHFLWHSLPVHYLPSPQLKQIFSGVWNVSPGQKLTQVWLKIKGYPGQLSHSVPMK